MSTSSFAKEVWETLSKEDTKDVVEQKGGFTYLSWCWAWGVLMEKYPESSHKLLKEKKLDNNTVEVRCEVTVRDGEKELTRLMWLPVMNHTNKPIENPTSRDISDSRMRCLVKCLALFGLGHNIYAGEDVPKKHKDQFVAMMETVRERWETIATVKAALVAEDYGLAVEAFYSLTQEEQEVLSRAASKGGIWSTAETRAVKSNEWSAARVEYFKEKEAA